VRHLGDSTVYSQQIREAKIASEGRDFSYSEQKQVLMTAQQVLEMPSDELLLLVGNRKPLKAKLNRYFENRSYKGKWDSNPLN
jgi:type IV secretion system protein VirD4